MILFTKLLSRYLSRKLTGLKPQFISICIIIPEEQYMALAEAYPAADQGGAIAFSGDLILLYFMMDED